MLTRSGFSTYHSLFAVPALVQALDFVLVAKELVHTYGLRKTSTQRAMEAISLPTADLGSSYERLEWYGKFPLHLGAFLGTSCPALTSCQATPVAMLSPPSMHTTLTFNTVVTWVIYRR